MERLGLTGAGGSFGGLGHALRQAGLPDDDIGDAGRQFFRFEVAGRDIGFGGLEPHGPDVLLRSVVVEPAIRGKGYGRHIVEELLAMAAAGGYRQAFLLTDTARPFFEALGFRVVARETAPAAIQASRQFASLCPASAVLMQRELA